ncbi:putative lipase YDR444W isoform X2 [Telopea speciosissima]|uniref:putative lipase YDR444W isoform X2 n=1 Tax=Telopea speciosissima TaxID=54955 RepID=UPI001CC51A1A|nr:putative lipase YDR444W isoform X2 [Telopea speciosissima]
MASASAPFFHVPYDCSPRRLRFKLRNGEHGGSSSHSSSSSSSLCCSSFDHRRGFSSNFCNSSGLRISSKHPSFRFQAMSTTQGNVTSSKGVAKLKNEPDHLLVLVHGILASPSDWTYVEAELKRSLGNKFLIYASSSNTYTKTFRGVDGAGKRLADEVMQVVQKTESLKRISFLAHSLGGLFARYAISVLYSSNLSVSDQPDLADSRNENPENSACSSKRGTVAGLEPINFITLATPHLGVKGRKQLPLLLGVPIFEKLAPSLANFFIGRTGCQLFLTDGRPSRPPLLLRMASDCEDGKFISALAAFSCRIVYANVSYDHMVGWRTSSIRREAELVKPPQRSLDGYKHVVDVEYCPPVSSDGPQFPREAAKTKEAAQNEPNTQSTEEYYDIIEEEMIHGLQRVGWKKVDVSFHSAFLPFFAHNNIHVKNEWLHNAGAGVVAHVADSLKQQESSTLITASL